MSTSAAPFVWYELLTTDVPAAVDFYRQVVGWAPRDAGMENADYTLMLAGEARIAGVMAQPPEVAAMGRPPTWVGYVGVDDVEATCARIEAAGGRICEPGQDIPGIGRFAVVADPQGVVFMLFKPLPGQQPPVRLAPGARGTVGWHELLSTDWESSFAFYAGLFGWTKGDAIDMGPSGTYQLFLIGDMPAGGMMTRLDDQPAPGWRFYLVVDEIEAAAQRVRDHGGRVLVGPHQVPGGSWILDGVDPQGAAFALTAPGTVGAAA